MTPEQIDAFEKQRPALMSIAYRMLGERGAAEDIVQEAWISWHKVDKSSIESPPAWLRTVTSRLAIDALRSAKVRREMYVGPWLPEPLISDGTQSGYTFALAQECELALLWAMERLSPEERSALILRTVFDSDYSELSDVIGKNETNCRKIVSRAKQKVKQAKTRYNFNKKDVEKMLLRFSQACVAHDHQQVLTLLAPDVIAISDGGGKVRAAIRPLIGPEDVSQVLLAIVGKYSSDVQTSPVQINGQAALSIFGSDSSDMISTVRLNNEGLIDWIYILRNPDKLLNVR